MKIRQRHLWFLLAYALLLSLVLLAGQRSRALTPPNLRYMVFFPTDATPKSAWENAPSLEAYLRSEGIPLPESCGLEFGTSGWGVDPTTRISFKTLGRSRRDFETWLTQKCGRDGWVRRWPSYHLGGPERYITENYIMGTPTDPFRGRFTILRIRTGSDDTVTKLGALEIYSTGFYYPGPAWPLLAILCALPVILVYVLRQPLARLIPERVRRRLDSSAS